VLSARARKKPHLAGSGPDPWVGEVSHQAAQRLWVQQLPNVGDKKHIAVGLFERWI